MIMEAIASILTSYKEAPTGYRYGFVHIYNFGQEKLCSLVNELKKKCSKLYYIVDTIHGKKEIYDN